MAALSGHLDIEVDYLLLASRCAPELAEGVVLVLRAESAERTDEFGAVVPGREN